ncbi:MAG: ATP-binding cassette domain-containing protein, partial [Gammaproteobacteria bacterium]|nr:ATP-binding cassette domain-containing protein [Gammaproteobacteria bacterium]
EGDMVSLIQFSVVLVGLAFAAALSHILRGTALMRLEGRLAARIGAAIQDRLLRMRPGFFRRHNAGELVSRSMVFQEIRDHVSGITVDAMLSTLFALPAFVLLFYYSAALGLAVLGLAVAAIGVTAAYCIFHIEPQRRRQETLRELTGELQQFLNGIAKLRTTGSEDSAFASWAKRYREQKRSDIRLSVLSERIAAFCAAMPVLASAVLFLVMGMQSDSGLSTADFLAVYTAAMVFFFSIVMLGKSTRAISFVKPACDQLRPILASPADGGPRSGTRHKLEGEILLDRVTFSYPETGATVLNHVTIHAKRGEFIAIVGESGAGKSTLFRLALGLEKPLSGAVYYDNRDLAHMDVGAVRRQIGVVTQNGALQNGSILDNIIGVADDLTLEDAWRAARQAAVDQDIKAMPMSLYTTVGEDSSTFSGGQTQRIRIAAALVRKPRILFLDEPTSWLDIKSQAQTMKGIEKSTATRLVIAHRLSTIRMANRIYVLHAGRVAQVGEFDELLAADGPFRELALRQMT